MADYMSGVIDIGGAINANIVGELLEAIDADKGTMDWGGDYFQSREELEQQATEYEQLRIFNDEAPYGRLETIEDFCVNHNIPFDRWSDSKYEYDCCWVKWRPGMENAHVICSNKNYEELVSIDLLERADDFLEQVRSGVGLGDDAWPALDDLRREIADAMGSDIVPLLPFTIEDFSDTRTNRFRQSGS